MADRFYTSDALGPGEHILTGAEAHHMLAVRRFAPGDAVTLFNGDGNEYPAEVVAAGKKAVTLRVLRAAPADRELPFPLVVASALPKGDRADFLIEKLTELGVSDFVPPDFACPKCSGTIFEKGRDVLDVWFESGTSWQAVLVADHRATFPADQLPAIGDCKVS